MTADPQAVAAAYQLVLADLKQRRDQLDQAIASLEASLDALHHGEIPHAPALVIEEPTDPAGQFLGMTITEAARKLLSMRRRALSNRKIAEALLAGGLVMHSSNPSNTVGSVLSRQFSQSADIVRVGRGEWGLAEWYPSKHFKRKADTGPATSAAGEDARNARDDR